jgi:hypothetical protein
MVDDVGRAERVQAAQIATSVAELIEFLHDRLVLCSVHSAISPPQQPAVLANTRVWRADPADGTATPSGLRWLISRCCSALSCGAARDWARSACRQWQLGHGMPAARSVIARHQPQAADPRLDRQLAQHVRLDRPQVRNTAGGGMTSS